ncbi:MAG: cell division protein ZipA [Rhodanobacter sp.]|nr:MAG: cell division protein ZipA [Rhodanobacter sp.]TAN25942.1 MAG: cell division protein ZipA [Rhodanobacter sp.]
MTVQPVLAFAWNAAVGVPLLIVGLIVLALIWLFGQPRKEQGKRRTASEGHGRERREPTVGGSSLADDPFFRQGNEGSVENNPAVARPFQGELDVGLREELERLGATLSGEQAQGRPRHRLAGHAASIVDALRAPSDTDQSPTPPVAGKPPISAPAAPRPAPRSDLGRRPAQLPVERIVTLFVVAREGGHFNGADLVVAAEKAGLEFGDMGIYHRLVDGKRELDPIFSVANMLKPGNFDLARLDALRTPGVSFFMTLPTPIPALDAWDAMLPTAQRLAELLDGQVLDEERNALGRQGIAHIRDQLRGWDRDHEGKEIIFGR